MSKYFIPQLKKAKRIAHNLGIKSGAGYMRNNGWSLQAALWNLLNVAEKYTELSAEFYLKSEQRYMAGNQMP